MAPFSSRSSSPGLTDTNATAIKGICIRLDEAKRDLEDLHILKLNDTLTRIQDLLNLCKNTKGNRDAIQKFTSLVTESIDKVLDPILKEKKQGEVEISKALTTQIQAFFGELFDAVPVKHQSSIRRMFRGVDVSGPLSDANRNMEVALQRFMSQGTIQCEVRPSDSRRVLDIEPTGEHSDDDKEIPDDVAQSPTPDTDSEVLHPTTDVILKALPRFRILLLGKSGVGKSSLINNIFGVPHADVAHFRAGNANINEEITSDTNSHFILHDSIGYESGSIEQFKIVQDFIEERGKKPISEQIHAIWLCTAVPTFGGRAFEVGDEMLFNMDLGRVPLIVVFTKYDGLVANIAMKICDKEGMDDDAKLNSAAKADAEQEFENACIQPLKDTYQKLERTDLPPLIKVSVNPGYEDSIAQLVQLTRQRVDPNVNQADQATSSMSKRSKDARHNDQTTIWLTWAIAQRADPYTSVEASIAVGRRKFWRALGSGLYFRKKALKQCMDTLHVDIVRVWNFYDPNELLESEQFRAMMTQSIDDVVNADTRDPNKSLAAGFGVAAGLAGLVGAVFPPGAIVVGPIAVSVVFAIWAYDLYRQTPGVLRCLMAYIVDLTCIMRRLFYLLQDRGGIQPLQEDLLRAAFDQFSKSKSKASMHKEIKFFVDKGDLLDGAKKDKVINEVVRLIEEYRFGPMDGVD